MEIITNTRPERDGYFIVVSFIAKHNGDTWSSQACRLPLEVWNKQKETELKEEFRQWILSKPILANI